jgi:hypothetical protein
MNCWPNGTKLTTQDLIKIGIEHGVFTDEDVESMLATQQKFFHGHINFLTRFVRYEMMCDGELVCLTKIREIPERQVFTVQSWAWEAKERGLNEREHGSVATV